MIFSPRIGWDRKVNDEHISKHIWYKCEQTPRESLPKDGNNQINSTQADRIAPVSSVITTMIELSYDIFQYSSANLQCKFLFFQNQILFTQIVGIFKQKLEYIRNSRINYRK